MRILADNLVRLRNHCWLYTSIRCDHPGGLIYHATLMESGGRHRQQHTKSQCSSFQAIEVETVH